MEAKIMLALEKLGITHVLKEKQSETLTALYGGMDCISVLPTGYGKSLIFQVLPWLLTKKGRKGIVIVVCPLTALMQDQVLSLRERGIRASFLDIGGTRAYTYASESEEEEADVPTSKVISLDMDDVKNGELEILYSHPEALFTSQMGKVLRSKVYQDLVCCIAVDEVHMTEEWGEDFRPKVMEIGDLTGIFPNAAHLAETATATQSSIQILSKTLQYLNPAIIQVNPDRPNIFIEIKTRLPNNFKFEKYDDIIEPIAKELKIKMLEFPVTIVYVESLEALGYFYQYLNYELKESQYIGEAIPENRIFGQFHKDYTMAMKKHIISELRKEEPKLRLILAWDLMHPVSPVSFTADLQLQWKNISKRLEEQGERDKKLQQ